MKTLECVKEILHDWMIDADERDGDILDFAKHKDEKGESIMEKAVYAILESYLPPDLWNMMHGEALVKVIEQVANELLEQLEEDLEEVNRQA